MEQNLGPFCLPMSQACCQRSAGRKPVERTGRCNAAVFPFTLAMSLSCDARAGVNTTPA